MTPNRLLAAAALALLVGAPGMAKAQYVFTTVDYPGSTSTAVNGNSPNAVAGQFDDADGNTHGFVMDNKGNFTRIDVPGALFTSVNGINAGGDLAGIYVNADGKTLGYFYSKGKFTTLDVPGSLRTSAFFLNAKGEVAGVYRDPTDDEGGFVRRGFVWRKGKFTTIDHPDAIDAFGTSVIGINDQGEVVGVFLGADGVLHGFVMDNKGKFTTLDAPAADGQTIPQGINNPGTIAGYFLGEDGNDHGFVLSKGVYKTVDVPGAIWTEIYSINAQGQIVGAYEDADGVHGFVGVPKK